MVGGETARKLPNRAPYMSHIVENLELNFFGHRAVVVVTGFTKDFWQSR